MSIFNLFKKTIFPANDLKPIKKTRNEYEMLCNKYNGIIDEIYGRISVFKVNHPDLVLIKKPSNYMNLQNSLSATGDWMGPVYISEQFNEKKVYRGIKKESVNDFIALWETGVLQGLANEGLIPNIKLSDYYSDKYPYIIETDFLTFKYYWEWNIQEQIDMLIFATTLCSVVRKFGINIEDPHYANMGFVSNKPIYFDIGSFSIIKDKNNNINDFSLIVLGFYRVIFSHFKDSILFVREPGRINNYGCKEINDQCFEYSFYRAHFLKFHRFHSSKTSYRLLKRIFSTKIVYPQDIDYLFN